MKTRPETAGPAYYPPRAGRFRPRFGLARRFRRFFADRIVIPQGLHPWWPFLLGLLVPGYAFFRAGRRRLAQGVIAVSVAALAVFLVWLGRPAADWAFLLLISAHVFSASYALQPVLQLSRLVWRMLAGVLLFTALSLLVYVPARNGFYRQVAMPLQMPQGVVVINPRVNLQTLRRGDWLAYQISGEISFRAVWVSAGYGFGPVLALPGDHVVFARDYFAVNGVRQARRAHMPVTGELLVPGKSWLVWPEMDIRNPGVSEDAVAQAMLRLAQVAPEQMVGRPYGRWFFRRQIAP